VPGWRVLGWRPTRDGGGSVSGQTDASVEEPSAEKLALVGDDRRSCDGDSHNTQYPLCLLGSQGLSVPFGTDITPSAGHRLPWPVPGGRQLQQPAADGLADAGHRGHVAN